MPPKDVEQADKPPRARKPRAVSALARINETIEQELLRIDALLESHPDGAEQHAEVDRRARTLASLARTLREVTNLRSEQDKQSQADDIIPRDLGEMRRALARRLEVLIAEAKSVHPAEAEEGSR